MSIAKKTVTTVEVTVPGDRPGEWITRTTQTTTIEQEFLSCEWLERFGPPVGLTEGEREELSSL